jgi:putative transposase
MPRIARAIAVDYPHHVTQRGNYQHPVFDDDNDFKQYLCWLKEYSRKYGLKIWAYCLMTNHVHFICVPSEETSLSKTFNALHMRYSQYLNTKRGKKGHLWQGRFYSSILDEKHLYTAVRYIENNPVRARMVEYAEKYSWSSTREHLEKNSDDVLTHDCYLEGEIEDWRAYLRETEDKVLVANIRKNSMTGRPCGDDGFIEKIEGIVGRRLKALPVGRPRKE